MSVTVTTTTYTVVEATVKVEVAPAKDSQGRRELGFTESDATSLMYALADKLGFDVAKR